MQILTSGCQGYPAIDNKVHHESTEIHLVTTSVPIHTCI